MIKEVSVGGISVSCFSSIKDVINSAILDDKNVIPGVGIAINPEKVIAASNDESIKTAIESATLRYPDGIGVFYVMAKKSGNKIARIPGCELWENLMYASAEQKIPVYLIGASEAVITETKKRLMAKGVNIVGHRNGYFGNDDVDDVISNIKNSGAKIVTVALGSPKQELFIFESVNRLV